MRAESEVARAGAEQAASKAKARNRRISRGETHQTQAEPTRAAPPSDFQQLQGCRAFQTASERIGMAVCPHVICGEGGPVLAARMAFCKWAPERQICHLVEKGFLPCLITYAVMDFLVIPPLRRRWDR